MIVRRRPKTKKRRGKTTKHCPKTTKHRGTTKKRCPKTVKLRRKTKKRRGKTTKRRGKTTKLSSQAMEFSFKAMKLRGRVGLLGRARQKLVERPPSSRPSPQGDMDDAAFEEISDLRHRVAAVIKRDDEAGVAIFAHHHGFKGVNVQAAHLVLLFHLDNRRLKPKPTPIVFECVASDRLLFLVFNLKMNTRFDTVMSNPRTQSCRRNPMLNPDSSLQKK